MPKLIISIEVRRDFYEIQRYLAEDLENPVAASRVISAIMKKIRKLEKFPLLGPSLEVLVPFRTDSRYLVCGKHIAIYEFDSEKDQVIIDRVIDGRRDYLRILFGEQLESEE